MKGSVRKTTHPTTASVSRTPPQSLSNPYSNGDSADAPMPSRLGETVAGIGNSLEEIPAGSTGQRETERGYEKMPPAGLPSSSETRGQNGGGRTEDGQ